MRASAEANRAMSFPDRSGRRTGDRYCQMQSSVRSSSIPGERFPPSPNAAIAVESDLHKWNIGRASPWVGEPFSLEGK